MKASRASRGSAAALALATLLAAACTSGLNYGGPTALRSPKAGRDGGAGPTISAEPTVAEPAVGARLRFVVRDGRGTLRSDIPVTYRRIGGGVEGTAVTRRGVATVDVEPGRYRLEVPAGCADQVLVQIGDGGTAGVVEDSAVEATFTVEATRRFWPSAPSYQPSAPWQAEEVVRARFLVTDRCDGSIASRAPFDALRYRASEHLELLDTSPMRADGDGYGHIRFRCVSPGDATLRLEDQESGERFELLGGAIAFTPDADWCA